jgi:hypothetical protein
MKPLRTSISILTTLIVAAATVGAHAAGFEFKTVEKESVDLSRDGKVIAKFMIAHDTSGDKTKHEATYKPYVHVFDPSGATRITKGPGFLWTHHRGIFIGFASITIDGKKYDRWHMIGGDQVVTKVTPTATPDKAEIVAEVEWQGEVAKNEPPIIIETRKLTFTPAAKPFYLAIDQRSSLKPKSEAKIDGDPEHAGVQFRASETIDKTKTMYVFPGANVDPHKAKDLPWMAEIATIEGKVFTILYLSDPENPKGASTSAYRDYGRFGAFPKGTATPEAPFNTHYQWYIAEGDVRDPAIFQKLWNAFAKKEEPTPAVTIRPADGAKAGDKAGDNKPEEASKN